MPAPRAESMIKGWPWSKAARGVGMFENVIVGVDRHGGAVTTRSGLRNCCAPRG